ncbi:MAG: DUF2628 domain-containing protein [Magnetovibrionaceae bacterium]
MNTYLAYRGISRRGEARLVLVRDRFSLLAGLFGPFWALSHGLPWLAALLFAGESLVILGLGMVGADALSQSLVHIAYGLLIALHAADLRGGFLELKGYQAHAVVTGSSVEEAERRLLNDDVDLAWLLRAEGA